MTYLRCKHLDPQGKRCVNRFDHDGPHVVDREDNFMPDAPPLPQIFLDAAALISGPRRERYGDYGSEAQRIATGWTLLCGHPIEPRHVPMMMIWLKLVRETHQPGQDNRNDCAGYLALLDQMLREKS